MVNKVILIGNLGRDPEVRSTPSGQPVATLSVATSHKWSDKNGDRQERTEWHTVVIWGRGAEIAGQYLTRGRQVYIEGRLQTRSWEDKTSGEKRYKTEIVCDEFKMLGNRGGGGDDRHQDYGGYEQGGGYDRGGGGGYQRGGGGGVGYGRGGGGGYDRGGGNERARGGAHNRDHSGDHKLAPAWRGYDQDKDGDNERAEIEANYDDPADDDIPF